MAEHGQCGVRVAPVAVPDQRQVDLLRAAKALLEERILGGEEVGFLAGQFEPGEQRRRVAAVGSGQAQLTGQTGGQFGIGRSGPALRIHEEDPEPVLNHIECHLAAAHRSLDEVHDEELGLVQQESVARIGGSGRESQERVWIEDSLVGLAGGFPTFRSLCWPVPDGRWDP